MATKKSSYTVPSRGRAQLIGTYALGCVLAGWLISQEIRAARPNWFMVGTFSFLILVNGWLWLWRGIMKIDVNDERIELETIRSKRTFDLDTLKIVRPFSAMPFLQVLEFNRAFRFYFVWAGFGSRPFFDTLRKLRPDLKFRLPTLTEDEEELLAEDRVMPTNTERKRLAKIAKAKKKKAK